MTTSSFDDERCKSISESLKIIRENISKAALISGRSPDDIHLMAVTKTVEAEYINYSIEHCSVDLIGENKVQEFLGKKPVLKLDGVKAHIIGHLQTNKVRKILPEVDMIQSVDSVHLASAINDAALACGINANILLEINIGSQESKTGFDKQVFLESLSSISEFKNLTVRGLMTIPPICDTEKELDFYFSEMKNLFEDVKAKKLPNYSMDILSMGMSADYESAIRNGSNLVRIGSAIYGARNYK